MVGVGVVECVIRSFSVVARACGTWGSGRGHCLGGKSGVQGVGVPSRGYSGTYIPGMDGSWD